MKTVIEYDLVRRMYHRDNLGKREISRQTGLKTSDASLILMQSL